jgi:F-type H+-transporting ATPase subunit b
MRGNKFWFILGLIATAGIAAAAEHGGHGGDLHSPKALIWEGINIAIVVGAIVYLFKDSFKKFVEDYKNQILKSITEAEEKHRTAKEELEKAKKALQEAKIKYEEGLKTAQEVAEKEKEMIISKAQEVAERIRQSAEKAIEIETNKAKEELRRYAAQKAIELSEKMLKELFKDKELQKRFTERMLAELNKN